MDNNFSKMDLYNIEEKLKEILKDSKYAPEEQVTVFGRKINIPVVYPDATAVMVFLPAKLDKITEMLERLETYFLK